MGLKDRLVAVVAVLVVPRDQIILWNASRICEVLTGET
jgi:hypothetical protein